MRSDRPQRTDQRILWALFVVPAVLLAAGCAGLKGNLPQEEGLHPRITRFAYLEEGKLVTLAVDTQAARQRETSKVVPLAIAVANNGMPRLTLTRESFTLIDDQGKRYTMASVQEGRTYGSLQILDLRLSQNFAEVMNGRFTAHDFLKTVFFPLQVTENEYAYRGLLRERTELSRQSWTYDVLYFPHPDGEWVGHKYELWMDTEELDPGVFVKFKVQ